MFSFYYLCVFFSVSNLLDRSHASSSQKRLGNILALLARHLLHTVFFQITRTHTLIWAIWSSLYLRSGRYRIQLLVFLARFELPEPHGIEKSQENPTAFFFIFFIFFFLIKVKILDLISFSQWNDLRMPRRSFRKNLHICTIVMRLTKEK